MKNVNAYQLQIKVNLNIRSEHSPELWNIFRKDRLPEESKWCVGFTDSFFRVFKILFYIFLFLVLIGGVIVTRGSLQILASLLGDHERYPTVSIIFDLFLKRIKLYLQNICTCLLFNFRFYLIAPKVDFKNVYKDCHF